MLERSVAEQRKGKGSRFHDLMQPGVPLGIGAIDKWVEPGSLSVMFHCDAIANDPTCEKSFPSQRRSAA